MLKVEFLINVTNETLVVNLATVLGKFQSL